MASTGESNNPEIATIKSRDDSARLDLVANGCAGGSICGCIPLAVAIGHDVILEVAGAIVRLELRHPNRL